MAFHLLRRTSNSFLSSIVRQLPRFVVDAHPHRLSSPALHHVSNRLYSDSTVAYPSLEDIESSSQSPDSRYLDTHLSILSKTRLDKKPAVSTEDLVKLLDLFTAKLDSADLAVLHLMREFTFDQGQLDDALTVFASVQKSFSRVKYEQIAPHIGLNPDRGMSDIETFELHRSRIPMPLFRSIVQEMNRMLLQYGPLSTHETEEATSRFLAPMFNHLVAEFGLAIKNKPELVIKGRFTTSGRIEHYFVALETVAVLFKEDKQYGPHNRLNAIAQVIAESDACDWHNSKRHIYIPVHGILFNGIAYEFFKFDGSKELPSFLRGCFPGDPTRFQRGIPLEDLTLIDSPTPFVISIRPICEIVFDLLLVGYLSSLKAIRERDVKKPSGISWDKAIEGASEALAKFRAADTIRHDDVDEADVIAEDAHRALKLSVEAVPSSYKPRAILDGWDEEAVRKA